MECHSKQNVTKNEMSLKLECYSNSNVIQNKMALKIKCISFQDWVNFTLIPCLPSGSLNTHRLSQCPWMIHCTNLKRFPQYLKCPRVNHSITSDENSPPASLQEAQPPFELPQVSPNGWGGVKAFLGICSKGSSFFLGMTSLSRPKVCYQRNGATSLDFLKLAYILLSEIILLFPSSVGVCVFESVNRNLEWIFTIYQYVLLR